MKRFASAVLVVLFAACASVILVAPAGAAEPEWLTQLSQSTARFHDVGAALDSGRVDLQLCVDHMGQHYADPNTFSDGVLDPFNPEAMVYATAGPGHLRLVAVEWVSTTPGEVMGIPLHFNPALDVWVLHAWVWFQNPDGTFEDMNPRIGACP